MTTIYSLHTLEQAIAHNLLIVCADSFLHDVVQLINQAHLKARDESPKSCISCVLVMDKSQLVGILTQSDLIRLMVIDWNIDEIQVSEVMTHPVVTMRWSEFQDVTAPLNLISQHHISHLPLLDEHDYPVGIITLKELLKVADITAQQSQTQRTEYESLLTAIANRIQSSTDLQVILDSSVTEIRQFLQTDRVIAYRFKPDWSGIVVAESVVQECDSLLGQVLTDPHFGEAMVEPYKNGRIQVTDNIYVGLTDCHTKFLEKLQVKSIIVVPILQGDQLWGLLAAQECVQLRFWDRASVALLQQLATHISIAIQQADTMLQLQQLNHELESRIVERTKALTNSENRLDLIVSNISEGILIANQEGKIVFANPSIAHTFGIPIENLFGLSIGIPNELNNQFEIDLLSHNGQIVGSEMQVVEIEWDRQPAYLMSLHDITERQRVEESLRKSEERLRQYFDQPLLGMAISNPDKSWQDANDCLCKMLGYSHDEMLQKNWAELTHPDDLEANVINFNKAIAGEIDGYVMDKRFVRENGEIIHTIIAAQCFRNLDKTVNYFILMVQDISDRKRAEVQLQITNEELSRATRLKDEFLANMSHELRTPLNAILGMTETMQEEVFGSINERQRKALQTVERSSEHLLSLINDILDVAKIESGQIELELTPTDIAALCKSSLVFIKQQALKKRIQLEIKLPKDLPEQMLDERRIRQVLINLLNNAMKFTPEGGRIILEASKQIDAEPSANPSEWFRLSVIDTGIGIAPENIKKLFQPFIQIDSALNRQYAGTGLGLALVKRIAELHGGKVNLTSELGVGSSFMVDLPYTSSSLEVHIANPSVTSLDLEDALAKQVTQIPLILMAEDNEANIMTISGYLEAKGYQLILAKNGQEAINLARVHQPDLILMDIQMPLMDGLEATRQIRLDPNLVNIPIIAMTALAMTGDREKCLEAGANEYVTKPVKLKALTQMIQAFLAKAQ